MFSPLGILKKNKKLGVQISVTNAKIISGQGQRKNNEDYYFPPYSSLRQFPWFLVCDGMGGAAKGEVASRLAVENFCNYFESNPIEVPDVDYLSNALSRVEQQFDAYLIQNPDAMGMGTTLTLLWLHKEGITIGHIGDSRIYRFRQDQVTLLTLDHSLVGDLVANGIITEEQAAKHPQKNVITRAIQGTHKGGTAIEVAQIQNIQHGDIYMLCSDGITESCPTWVLGEIYRDNAQLEYLADGIQKRCEEQSKDNFTGFLIELDGFYAGEMEEKHLKKQGRPCFFLDLLNSWFSKSTTFFY